MSDETNPNPLAIVIGFTQQLGEVKTEQGVARTERADIRRDHDKLREDFDEHLKVKPSAFSIFMNKLAENSTSFVALLGFLALIIFLIARASGVDTSGIKTPFISADSATEKAP